MRACFIFLLSLAMIGCSGVENDKSEKEPSASQEQEPGIGCAMCVSESRKDDSTVIEKKLNIP